MIYFGVPLKSKAVSANWDVVQDLFHNTLKSILRQTGGDFHVLLGCTDEPDGLEPYRSKVTTLYSQNPIPETLQEKMEDKGAKKRLIGAELRRVGGGLLMWVDADDLISRKIAEHAAQRPTAHGFYAEDGFELDFATGLVRKREVFHQFCGTCAAVRFGADELPTSEQDMSDCYYNKFQTHKKWLETSTSVNRPLEAWPFPAAMYVRNTNENWTGAKKNWSAKEMAKRALGLERKPTPDVVQDFGLADLG